MIRYHGTDFNGKDSPVLALQGRHAMVSYARPEQLPEVAELCQSFALDNGAYTAWSNKTEFNAEGFFWWVEHWRHHPGFDWALIPDAIDADDESENKKLIDIWGDKFKGPDMWTPVWHLHESLDFLNWQVQNFKRVALGSSGQYATPGASRWWARIAEAMEILCDDKGRPKVRIHGLRMLDPTIFSHVPFASADSTNAARNISLDSRWQGTYAPASTRMRALILMERIENHAAASRWSGTSGSGVMVQKNMDLLG